MAFDGVHIDDMTDADRERFEGEHFDLLTPEQKLKVSVHTFLSGRDLNGEQAQIIDKAMGNGDGTLGPEDLKLIKDKLEDKLFMGNLERAGETLAGTAVLDNAVHAIGSFPVLNSPGFLGGLFNASANGTPIMTTAALDVNQTFSNVLKNAF